MEEIISAGKLIAKLENKNPKYAKQGIFVVSINNYVHAVPFEEFESFYIIKNNFSIKEIKQSIQGHYL